VGDSVREDLALDDAVGEGECLTSQLLAPWVRWRYGQGANLTVRRGVQRKQDELALAQAQESRSKAYGNLATRCPRSPRRPRARAWSSTWKRPSSAWACR